jgi:hypothetical protein
MPIPRHSTAVAHVQLACTADCKNVTELRVHGVGGSPPDAILGDLAPEQASGDAIAGFYRSSDHRASDKDPDVDRHVEVYSWGGLTSRSKVRVLWLALLPFLFGNLAGWMCSVKTRNSAWRFRLHRLAAGLGALALTVNAALIAVMISADVLAYQTARAGLAAHQWWLAPLGWHFVSGHPARQVMIGVLVPVLFVLALVWLASKSWRYEHVRPPREESAGRRPPARKVTAATLPGGLADDEFWDGENSVRLLTWLHVAVVAGFLAIVLGVTAKALTGSPHVMALGWIGIGLGGTTIALGVAYVGLDSLGTPAVNQPNGKAPVGGGLADRLRAWLPFLLVPAAAALIGSGVFAWLQPGGPARAAELPGMASVIGWTTLAIAIPVAAVLVSVLLGLPGGRTLFGGALVTLMLGFSVLNTVLLGVDIWVAHLVGPVTGNAAVALARPHGQIYLPYVITSGVPLLAWAAVLAVLAFGLTEMARWWRVHKLPDDMRRAYQRGAHKNMAEQPSELQVWYESCLPLPASPGGDADVTGDQGWERNVARRRFLAGAPLQAGWLLWGIITAQLVIALCVWQLHLQPPAIIRDIGVILAGFLLPVLMGFLYSAWNDPTRRRAIGVLWDVGTFWPRSYHPLSPPCYTERAVPELQRRMWWVHDSDGRVVLIAHSQGAMLATAALVQPGCRAQGDRPALITFGSPVVKLYGWGFPAYVTEELLKRLAPGGEGRVNSWHNLFYPTDPIGGPVGGDLPSADGSLVDRDLLDPAQCWYIYGQDAPAPQGHSGYWADPRVWDLINRDAARG